MPAHLDSVLHGGSITAVVGAVPGMPAIVPVLIVGVIVVAAVVVAIVVSRRRAARRIAPSAPSASARATGSAHTAGTTAAYTAASGGHAAAGAPHTAAGTAANPAGSAQRGTQTVAADSATAAARAAAPSVDSTGASTSRAAAPAPDSAATPGTPAVASAAAAASAPVASAPSLVHPKAEPVVISTPHPKRNLATMTMPLTTAIPIVPSATTGSVSTGKKTVLDYIDERTIVLDVDETDRDRMIRTLAGMMSTTGRITDVALVAQAAFRRETHGTTSMGNGIAIAHAKSEAVLAPVLAFARSKHGIDWNSADGEKATLIFMIAVPKASAGTEHLRVLSQLSRCLAKPAFRAAIQSAQTPAAVLEALAISANLKKPEHPQA